MHNDSTSDHDVNKNLNQSTSEDTPNEALLLKATDKDMVSELDPEEQTIPFTMIPNEILDHLTLSPRASFLLMYLLRHIPGWQFYDHYLLKRMGCCQDTLQKLFRELREAGYVRNVKTRNKLGQVVGEKRQFSRTPKFEKAAPLETLKKEKPQKSRERKKPATGKTIGNNNTVATDNKSVEQTHVASSVSVSDTLIVELHDFYKVKLNHSRSTIEGERGEAARKLLTKAIKKYGMSDCKKAILGCMGSDFHMGRLPKSPAKQNSLRVVFKDDIQVDKFIEMYEEGGSGDANQRVNQIMKGTI